MSPAILLRTLPSLVKSRMGSGVTWIAIDTVAARGIPLIAMLLVARALGAQHFGQLTMVLGTLTLFGSFVAESVRLTAVKHVAAIGVSDREALGRVLGLVAAMTLLTGTSVAVVLKCASGIVAEDVLKAPHLAVALETGVWLILFDLVAAAQKGILTGIGATRSMAFGSVISGLVLAVAVALIPSRASLESYVLAFTAASLVGAIIRGGEIGSRLRQHSIRFVWRLTSVEWSILWSFSLPAMLSSIVWAPVNWAGMTLLARRPDGFTQVGIVGVALHWFSALLFLPNIVANAALPRFADAADRHRSASMLSFCVKGILGLVVPAALLLAALAAWLLQTLYGASFVNGTSAVYLVLAAAVPASIINLLEYALAARDRMWTSFLAGALWAVTYLGAAFVGVSLGWGANALALAMLCAYSVKMCRHMWLLRQSERSS